MTVDGWSHVLAEWSQLAVRVWQRLAAAAGSPDTALEGQLLDLQTRIVHVAFYSAVVLCALICASVAGIVALRAALHVRQRQQRSVLATWQPRMIEAVLAPERPALPTVRPHEWDVLMLHWNHLHGFLRGEARENLIGVANELGMSTACARFLATRSLKRQLLAIVTLGNMQVGAAWDVLVQFLESDDAFVALVAMRALAMIDIQRAMPRLIPQIATRHDWSPVSVANVLFQAGLAPACLAIAEAARTAPPDQAVRLLRYLATPHHAPTAPIIREVLREATDERLISACLQVMRDPADLDLVRGYLNHPRWFIRVQAASALGRLGLEGDEERLAGLLSDREWWVRYRAAQSLARLPFLTMGDLARIGMEHPDPFARDMMIQVIAETAVK